MNYMALIEVDLSENSLGLCSRLGDQLGDVSLLQQVVNQARSSKQFSQVMVACRVEHEPGVRDLLSQSSCEIYVHQHSPVPRRREFQRKRKWVLTGWRGGIDHTFSFCENGCMALVCDVFEYCEKNDLKVDGIVILDSHQPFIAVDVLEGIFNSFERNHDELGVAFATTPPGLNYYVVNRTFANMLGKENLSLREVMRYNPAEPQVDPTIIPFCFCAPLSISSSRFRFQADTSRYFSLVATLWQHLAPEDRFNGQAIIEMAEKLNSELLLLSHNPREIELEITSQSNIQDGLYPEGQSGRESQLSLEQVEKLLTGIKDDDVCVTLGGFGDPLLHPDLIDIIKACEQKGVFGIHVASNGLALDEAMGSKLLETNLDLLSIRLDAHSEGTYKTLKQGGDYGQVVKHIDGFIAAREGLVHPALVLPVFTKVLENMQELEAFYDHWYEKLNWCVIRGCEHWDKDKPDRNVLRLMTDPQQAYLDVFEQLMIFSNLDVPTRQVDYRGKIIADSLHDGSIEDLWRGENFSAARRQWFDAQ